MEQGGCAGGGGDRQSLVVPSSPGHGDLTAMLPWPVGLGRWHGQQGTVLVPAQCDTHTTQLAESRPSAGSVMAAGAAPQLCGIPALPWGR